MKKKIQNTSLMFLLLIAVCFPTHNNVYEQNMDSKRVNICPKTYNRKKW